MSMKTKLNHTPAPWHLIHSDGQLRVDSERDGAVAICHTLMRGEFKMPSECVANARLISAAPELLACLLDVLDADGDLDAMDFKRYRAAIERATG